MRQVVLDTETTGLEPELGHRIIEIGAVELVDRQRTGKRYHSYLNPERDIEHGALEVHGITEEFLADKPLFADIADDLLAFIEGAELVIHNAPFDIGFIEHELSIAGHVCNSVSTVSTVLDTLELARELHPGQRNNLDALCKRYEVDNSSRTLHGALLDAEILADVYLAMTGGQEDLGLSLEPGSAADDDEHLYSHAERPELLVLRASNEELALHEQRLADIEKQSGSCLYRELEAGE
jgi:DNA polymerase-3 subunit epsilon